VLTFVVHCKRSAYDVYIGRPGIWGNPFSHQEGTLARFKVVDRDEAVDRYEAWVMSQPELVQRIKRELKSKILGCWCIPNRCHGEVLAKIANEDYDLVA
jgi:hypothetical protein